MSRALDAVNLDDKLTKFEETWVPKVVGELNGQYVKVAKFLGEYIWHDHAGEDELFLVLRGRLQIHLRDGPMSVADWPQKRQRMPLMGWTDRENQRTLRRR